MFLVGAAMFGLFYFLSLSMQQVLGYSALETGLAQLPLAGTLVVAAGLIAPLVTAWAASRSRSPVSRRSQRGSPGSRGCRPTPTASPTSSAPRSSSASVWPPPSSRSSRRAPD
jgi:hypothetical protein